MMQELNAVYNCDANMTTSSRKPDLMFVRPSRVTADYLLREGPADFADVVGESNPSLLKEYIFLHLTFFTTLFHPF